MKNKSPRPAGTPWMLAYVMVSDVDRSLELYQAALGFKVLSVAKDEQGKAFHAELTYQDQMIMIGKVGCHGDVKETPAASGLESPVSLYFYCEDVDAFYAHALKAGMQSVTKPEDMFWGDRTCRVKDADGYVWAFGTHLNL